MGRVLVATVNFPFVATQNFSLWACRFRRTGPLCWRSQRSGKRCADVRMGDQDVAEALSRPGRFEDRAVAAVPGDRRVRAAPAQRLCGGAAMKPPAPTRRDRLRAMLADLRMPGALEAGVLGDGPR